MRRSVLITLVAAIMVILAACRPQSAPPAPAPLTQPAAPAPATAAPSLPSASTQDAAWAKVVEAARKEGALTIYSYSWVGDAGVGVTKAFADAYGIKLQIITGRGAEFVERMKTEQRIGQVTGDVMEGATTHLGIAKASGLLAPVGAELPAIKEKGVWNIEPLFVDPEGYFVPVIPILGPPFVNTRLVKPEDEPKSWRELLDPKWKSKTMLQDPVVSTGAYRLLGYVSHKVFDEEALRRLGEQDPRYSTGIQQEVQFLARGERPLSILIGVPDAASSVAEGAPIKALSMKEGVVAWEIVAGAVKNSTHPNAARLFLNWMLSKEGQTVNGRLKAISSIRSDVADFTPPPARVTGKLLVLTPAMLDEQTKAFGDKYLAKLWKR
ncbi:MAG: extracellular solute-binding protein [Chloroflexi bacterium]|nr:extracellular solute-binding protein [Chloroflexota bacterium]